MKTYLAGGAGAGVQERTVAVVASAVRVAGILGEGSSAVGTLVGVLHLGGGASHVDERSLLNEVSGLGLGSGNDGVPVGLSGSRVALRSIFLGDNTDNSGGNEEEVLEGNHCDSDKNWCSWSCL